MKRSNVIEIISLAVVLFFVLTANGQTPPAGGQFTVARSVVAGGGTTLEGGQLSMHGTAGQTAARSRPAGGQFRVYSGFWTPSDLMPTAANVNVAGRLLTTGGQGIRNATVVLTDHHGVQRYTRSGSFGYYRFDEVPIGETYIISVTAKRYTFTPQTITVMDELTDIDLIGRE